MLIPAQIRNKRLAKLASQAPSSQSSSQAPGASEPTRGPSTTPSEGPSTPQEAQAPRPQINVSSAPPSLATSPRPELQQSEGKRIKITPAAGISTVPPERPQSTSIPPKRATPKPEESLEAFEDRTLSAIFKVSLKEDRQHDMHGQKLIYLPGVRAEFEDQGREPRMEVSVLDQALLEAASNIDLQKPLDYLLPCWKRVSRVYKGFRKSRDDDPKFDVIREARRLCMSYCIFAITMPEMFGCVASTSDLSAVFFLAANRCLLYTTGLIPLSSRR